MLCFALRFQGGRFINVIGSDPLNPDTDGDGVNDGVEVNSVGSDPLNPDTDGDLIPDGFEVTYSIGVLDPASAAANPDGDAYTNLQEYQNGTNPLQPDP